MSVLKAAAQCWRQAAEAEIQAAQITDQHLKAVYLRIARQWSDLARSYEFADSAEHFLLDAKRTKDANPRQTSGELVHLPSSLARREPEHLLKPHQDGSCQCHRGPATEPPCLAGIPLETSRVTPHPLRVRAIRSR
jgi:hypothetical protein